ncbi:MAG: ABC transporter ATP-binding protein [Caldilineaceae bacterium]|nr:ABC transporter ATP-binding protein [Caldilineaceae bacterium]
MTNRAIQVETLSKRYRIGVQETRPESLVQALTGWAKAPIRNFRRLRARTHFDQNGHEDGSDTIWALKDVSFEVEQGETLGIIGRNGAGKSTLLKILSRITEPTSGRAVINGRVASLLEVGTGFHPELTGRENVYLNATILGMRKTEVDRKFDEIVGFSGVEKFIDTPVKFYSSGMKVRLAFSVAAHLEPDILIIDEVLAVGDAEFQKKCLGKMGDVATEGRTVLFVSHNLVALRSLCPRAIWLEQGQVQEEGPSSEIVADYLQLQASKVMEQCWDDIERAPGNEIVRLHRVWVTQEDQLGEAFVAREMPLQIGIEYWNLNSTQLHATLHVYVGEEVMAFSTASCHSPHWQQSASEHGLTRCLCEIPNHFLNTGIHRIHLLIVRDRSKVVHTEKEALSFEVVETEQRSGAWYGKEPGVVRPSFVWCTENLSKSFLVESESQP